MKVSVFVVTYNQEKYIQECLNSILCQNTNFLFEVIIGDDFSIDNTRSICEDYSTKYNNVILLESKSNLGVIGNWLRVLNRCSGQYIALCEGDDYWIDPYKLQKQVDILESDTSISMCISNRKVLLSDGSIYDDIYQTISFTLMDILKGTIPHTQTMVFRNNDNKKMCDFLKKMCEGLDSGSDRALAYWCSLFGNIFILHEMTAVYRWNGIGVWSGYSEDEIEFNSLIMYFDFHKRLSFPDRFLFIQVFSKQCLDFIYLRFRHRKSSIYCKKVLILFIKELSFFEIIRSFGQYFRYRLNLKSFNLLIK